MMIKKKYRKPLFASIIIILVAILAYTITAIITTNTYNAKLKKLADQLYNYKLPDQSCKYLEKAWYSGQNKLTYRVILIVSSDLDLDTIADHYSKASFRGHKGDEITVGIRDLADSPLMLDVIEDSRALISRVYKNNCSYQSFYFIALYDYDDISDFDIEIAE